MFFSSSSLQRNNIEKLRESKWLDMLKNWSAYSNQANSKFLKVRRRSLDHCGLAALL